MRAAGIGLIFALAAHGAVACPGQSGKILYEDAFKDDAGGWTYEETSFVLKAPGAAIYVKPGPSGNGHRVTNATFKATDGDYCAEVSFPQRNADTLDPAVGLVFLASDIQNFFLAMVRYDGSVSLTRKTTAGWTPIWQVKARDWLRTAPGDVNAVRAVVKGDLITVSLNGQVIKAIRAQIPPGDLGFGLHAEYNNASADPQLFPMRSVKVTEPQ